MIVCVRVCVGMCACVCGYVYTLFPCSLLLIKFYSVCFFYIFLYHDNVLTMDIHIGFSFQLSSAKLPWTSFINVKVSLECLSKANLLSHRYKAYLVWASAVRFFSRMARPVYLINRSTGFLCPLSLLTLLYSTLWFLPYTQTHII